MHGRSDDVLNVNGHRVGTGQIEASILRDKLRENSPVGNCIIVGVADELTGQTPWAFITLMPGGNLMQEDLRQLERNCSSDVGEYAVPSEFVVVDDIPETLTGKYMRRVV